jgi:hypothetical protein
VPTYPALLVYTTLPPYHHNNSRTEQSTGWTNTRAPAINSLRAPAIHVSCLLLVMRTTAKPIYLLSDRVG